MGNYSHYRPFKNNCSESSSLPENPRRAWKKDDYVRRHVTLEDKLAAVKTQGGTWELGGHAEGFMECNHIGPLQFLVLPTFILLLPPHSSREKSMRSLCPFYRLRS